MKMLVDKCIIMGGNRVTDVFLGFDVFYIMMGVYPYKHAWVLK